MGLFDQWCDEVTHVIGVHSIVVLRTDEQREAVGLEAVAKAIPAQYVSTRRYARLLKLLGKNGAAEYLRDRLPQAQALRSGDLGEVLALTFVEEHTAWGHTVKKLRWKDHRDMPMRGDDLLAIRVDGDQVRLLKGEAKSRRRMSRHVLQEAEEALKANDGRPSPHALAFYADRLDEEGHDDLADAILTMQYGHGIPTNRVSHMLFSFSGNDPESLLRGLLENYEGEFEQAYVGLCVENHRRFVHDVFEKIGSDGDA